MSQKYKKKTIGVASLFGVAFFAFACTAFFTRIFAANNSYNPTVTLYENSDAFYSSLGNAQSFVCGTQAGYLSLSGSIQHQGDYYGTTAYAATECINIAYDYTGVFQTGDPDKWNIVDSDEKNVDGTKLSKKIQMGTIIIQRSYDGRNWEDACEPIYNCFDEKNDKVNLSYLYSIESNDIRKGTYYRVLVLYEMKKKTGTESAMFGLSEKDVYDTRFFVEKYDFYVCYGSNPVQMYNVLNRTLSVSDKGTVTSGFMIDTNGTNVSLSVTRDNYSQVSALNYQSFFSPGKYSIVSTNPIGDSFTTEVTVTGGLETSGVSVTRYVNREKDGYVVSSASGGTPLTSLRIAQNSGSAIKTSTVNSFSGYGITGDSVNLFLRLDEAALNASGWYLENDDWGKKEKETVDGVWVGQIQSGALIVQKSSNGRDWENIDAGKYSNGIYTTDFYKNFNGTGDILIYSPEGTDVLNGVYLRVLFAYEVANESGKDDKRVIEEYKFYLCCNELDAVTIHNLTASDTLSQAIGDADATTQEIYRRAETMTTGAVTVSGFSIDTSLNPTVSCVVLKNGSTVPIPANATFTDTGKYEIRLTSAVGSTKKITIYVDRLTIEQTMDLYFGDGFIDGKRIYAEGYYPTYEAGYTSYHFEAVSDNYQPLYGHITNLTTQRTTTINAYRNEKNDAIIEPGEYEVILSNNPTFNTDYPSGDNKIITIHFTVIPEGTAPGPTVNRNSLEDYVNASRIGSYPKYYGLTFSSAASGYITLAFATREAAFQYAYNYERGMVEEQPDGSYRYIGSFLISEKEKYDSAWDLADALNYYAEMAIHEMYFDISDEATYLTLHDYTLDSIDNPRTLELKRSVVLFGDDQKEQLTNLDALPILNDVPYAYLNIGVNGATVNDTQAFEFIKDKYGCDSNSVVIIDESGREYPMEYNESVGQQLQQMGCPTGIVRIVESTVYGDSTEYEAVFFAEGDNTATIQLACYQNGEKTVVSLSQDNDSDEIITGAFSIQDVVDYLDPYDLILVTDSTGKTESFVADKTTGGAWSDVGTYTIKVVNRIGNNFSFRVTIQDSEYATISFQGMGTEDFESIILKKGDKNISLPVPQRYGYEFTGYWDENGDTFDSEITQVDFSGSRVLTPIWKPMKVSLTFVDSDGNTINSAEADFGAFYELNPLSLKEGYKVSTWSLNGIVISDDRIQVTDMNPITIVVTLVPDETYNPDENTGGKRSKAPIVIILLILAGCGSFIFIKKKKGEHIIKETIIANVRKSSDKNKNFDAEESVENHKSTDSTIEESTESMSTESINEFDPDAENTDESNDGNEDEKSEE